MRRGESGATGARRALFCEPQEPIVRALTRRSRDFVEIVATARTKAWRANV